MENIITKVVFAHEEEGVWFDDLIDCLNDSYHNDPPEIFRVMRGVLTPEGAEDYVQEFRVAYVGEAFYRLSGFDQHGAPEFALLQWR